MLHISQAQIDTLSQNGMAGFEAAALAHLRSELGEVVAERGDDMLLAFIRQCVPRAGAYGLDSGRQVLAFIDTAFLLNDPDFDSNPEFPWARRILQNQRIDDDFKAEALLDWAYEVAISE